MLIILKKNKNLKPDIILKKIQSEIKVSPNNTVSFTGFTYDNAMAALRNMIQFPENLIEETRERILNKAVHNIAIKNKLTSSELIQELNDLVKVEFNKKEEKYFLLTSISISNPIPIKQIDINGCNIRIFSKNYPNKYTTRNQLINNYPKFNQSIPKGYSNLIASIKSKSAFDAVTKCLDEIDLLRGVWCLLRNSTFQLCGEEWSPINKVRLGEVHTIHKSNGKVYGETFWYEPNFVLAKPYKVENVKIFRKNVSWIFMQLKKCKYSKSLTDSILRYVRALDEKNQNFAVIQLWGAIENLVAPNFQNYDQVTKRCSFLFKERDYHKQVLEHLREYRNQSIHSGDRYSKAKTICYQLQFYFYNLVLFHMHNVGEFNNLDEANNFLDLPSNKKTLERRRRLIDKAMKFFSSA